MEVGSLEYQGEKIAYGEMAFLRSVDPERVKEVHEIIKPLVQDRVWYKNA